jgi:hypothetical protein
VDSAKPWRGACFGLGSMSEMLMKVNRRDGFLIRLYLRYQDKGFYDSFRLFLIVSELNTTLPDFSILYSTSNSISVNKWDSSFFFLRFIKPKFLYPSKAIRKAITIITIDIGPETNQKKPCPLGISLISIVFIPNNADQLPLLHLLRGVWNSPK